MSNSDAVQSILRSRLLIVNSGVVMWHEGALSVPCALGKLPATSII